MRRSQVLCSTAAPAHQSCGRGPVNQHRWAWQDWFASGAPHFHILAGISQQAYTALSADAAEWHVTLRLGLKSDFQKWFFQRISPPETNQSQDNSHSTWSSVCQFIVWLSPHPRWTLKHIFLLMHGDRVERNRVQVVIYVSDTVRATRSSALNLFPAKQNASQCQLTTAPQEITSAQLHTSFRGRHLPTTARFS